MKQENGFATIAILAFLIGLTSIAVALTSRSIHLLSTVKKETAREQSRLDMRSATRFEAARYLNSENASLSSNYVEFSQGRVEVSASNEQHKIDVNRAEFMDIEAAFEALGDINPSQSAEQIFEARNASNGEDIFRSIDAVVVYLGLEGETALCLHEALTAFASTFDPLQIGRRGRTDSSGAILNLKSRLADTREMDLVFEEIVVFTGDKQRPIWSVYERYFRPSEMGACGDTDQ